MAAEKNFRPLTFDDYMGQEKAKKILKIAIKAAQIKGGYLDHLLISGPSGVGKAQPVDTVIPTPDGHRTLGDIKVGDYVFDRCGNPTEVIGVFPQGRMDNWKVTLADGRFTYCNNEHLWSVYENSKRSLTTYSLQEIMDKGLRKQSGEIESHRFSVPINHRLYFPTKNFDIHPYIIGAFLGDGCCTERQLTISSENEEIPNHIASLLPARYSAHAHKNSDNNYNWSFILDTPQVSKTGRNITKLATKTLFADFEAELCNDCHSKRIPEPYFYGSREERLSLLQGLLDTDGYARNDHGRAGVSFTSVNLDLIKDVVRLVRELGFYTGKIKQDARSKKYKTGKCYSITISCDDKKKPELFWLNRKVKTLKQAIANKTAFHNYSKMPIVSIEKMPEQKEMVCIYVDNEEHLYLTNDCIVTHNTTLARIISNESKQTLKMYSAPSIKKVGDMVDILQQVDEGDCLVIDEVHSLNRKIQETLFLSMENFTINANIDGEVICQQLPHFTVVAMTTSLAGLELPMRNRFQLHINLVPYTEDNMTTIVNNVFKSMSVDIDKKCAGLIAGCSRGVPRNANSYCRRVYDVALVTNDGVINEEVVRDTFDLMDINEYGLNSLDMSYLEWLYQARKTVGVDAIALGLGTDKKSVEYVIEPYLVSKGFVSKGPRGRKITQKGCDVVERYREAN